MTTRNSRRGWLRAAVVGAAAALIVAAAGAGNNKIVTPEPAEPAQAIDVDCDILADWVPLVHDEWYDSASVTSVAAASPEEAEVRARDLGIAWALQGRLPDPYMQRDLEVLELLYAGELVLTQDAVGAECSLSLMQAMCQEPPLPAGG